MKFSNIQHGLNRPRLPVLMSIVGALLFAGCDTPLDQNTPTASENTPTNSELPHISSAEAIKALENMGYTRDQIVEKKTGFIVDGDMFFTYENLSAPKGLAKISQRQSQAVTAAASLRLAIHSSISSYATVIQQAVNNWNSLKTRVHIEIVPSGSAEITVYSDASTSCPSDLRNLGTSTHAIAYVASGGSPGSSICVNMDNSQMLATERNRVSVLTHEMGHSIGFRHTNSTDGTLIPGTPTTDANSIMGSDGTVAQGIFLLRCIDYVNL